MAHGGHCGGGGHAHSHSRSGGDTPGWVLWLALALVAVFVFIEYSVDSANLSNKHPLEGKYEIYPSYVIDESEYFSETEELIDGLRYVYEKTNIQVVVMSSSDSWTDDKAVEKYYELFEDEAHILIICPTAWYSSTVYYAIGDLADTVIDDYAIDHLIDNVDNSRRGSKWKKYLISLTDRLLEPKE